MRGLMCGTSTYNPYNLDDITSEEESSAPPQPKRPASIGSSRSQTIVDPSPSSVVCKVCTTFHHTPIPTCCESCNNVLEPDKLDDRHKWVCQQEGCFGKETGYVNFVDAGRCGLCGAKWGSWDIRQNGNLSDR